MMWSIRPLSDPIEWNEWFAWRPVRIGSTRVWLERVERQLMNPLSLGLPMYDYRKISKG